MLVQRTSLIRRLAQQIRIQLVLSGSGSPDSGSAASAAAVDSDSDSDSVSARLEAAMRAAVLAFRAAIRSAKVGAGTMATRGASCELRRGGGTPARP